MLIQVENLSYTYAPDTPLARVALRGVNLEIGDGERVGILGASGSGKSTLVQHLAGLLEPTSGRVLLNGTATYDRTSKAHAQWQRIGLAFQNPEDQVFEQTVFREVAFGPRNLGLEATEVADRVHWALDMVGLNPEAVEERVPFTLSGGEIRRVALASILAMRPQVLILDEPTAGLDPQGRRELLDRVLSWQEATGMTLIMVSHNLDELVRVVERVVLLAEGRIVASGSARRVLSDIRLLRSIGLDAPQSVTLLQTLCKEGWKVHTDRLLPEEVVAEIARARWLLEGDL